MADGGMDPCECFWSHELAMRRLLSILRQSQTVCTDSECLDEVPGLPGMQQTPENNLMLMMVAYMAFVIIMYMIRPRSLRNKSDSDYRNNEGDDGRPPMPPAVN